MAIKILIGGSPCTKWSIAQKNNRETEPSGEGWELFVNYLIAKAKFKPDLFLYENNKSAAQAIKDQIAKELGVGVDPNVRFTYINSALVSAQHRQRFYVTNFGDIELPQDRKLTMRDILETDVNSINYLLTPPQTPICVNSKSGRAGIADIQPSLSDRIYSIDGKSPAITASYVTKLAEPLRIGTIKSELKNKKHDSKQYRVYSPDGKATTLCGQGGGVGAKAGIYAVPSKPGGEGAYEVVEGAVTIDGERYPIRLPDGLYVIRQPTIRERCRLQTLPDDYCKAVSDNQAAKALGNGWTAEVIIHLLNHALKDVPRDEEIVVLSMYDGIATGRYCLDMMGFTNVQYHAYEIDPYPVKVAMDNYPDIIQHGNAFAVREDDWKPPQTRSEWLDELLGGGE